MTKLPILTSLDTSFDEYWIQPNLEWSYGADISSMKLLSLELIANADTMLQGS